MFTVWMFVFVGLIHVSLSYPKVSSSHISRNHEPVATDLQKLSIWFQHCHIHIILTGNEVPLNLIPNPYILTVPHPLIRKLLYKRCVRGRFSMPASSKMVAPCQATFYINLLQVHAMAYNLEVRLAEECTRVYKLKDRYSIILAFKEKFEAKSATMDRSAGRPGGGNVLLALLYDSGTGNSAKYPAIQSALVICEHCVRLQRNITCSSVETCLTRTELTYQWTAQGGKAITWGFLPSDFRPLRNGTQRFTTFQHCLYRREQHNLDCATFPKHAMMNYIVGGLNNTLMAPTDRFSMQNLRRPGIAWSEDDLWMERVAVTRDILQIQVYPMRSENKSRTSLRFITADGVEYRIPSLSMYTQPLDTALWLGSLGFFILAILMIALVGKVAEGTSPVVSAQWSMFWLYGAVVEQVQAVPRARKSTARNLVAQVLSVAFLLAFLMSNYYRAELNVNYIAGNDLVPVWHRIDQILNFTALYVPMGTCTWEIAKELAQLDKDDELLSGNKLHFGCTMGLKQFCRGLEDELPCVLSDEKDDLVWAGRGGVCSSYVHYMQRNGRKLKPMTPECQRKRINVLRGLNRRLKYVPVDQLATYVRNHLTKPNTALISTEAMLGVLWKEFEKAMEEDPKLKFSHNLFSPQDTTIANRDSRLQIVSGMKPEYTRVVTDRVHSLLSTGVWDFWIDIGIWRNKLLKLDRFTVPDFAPLTLKHDGMYLLFMLIGIFLGLSGVVFVTGLVWNVWADNSKVSVYLRSHACGQTRQPWFRVRIR